MNRYSVVSVACAVALVSGCRGGSGSDDVPATLPGSYVYSAKGSTFKKPWQFAARIDLRPDKSYTFTLDKTMDGKTEPTETSNGAYAVDGDHVLIRNIGWGASKDIHKLLIKSDSLIAEVGWTTEIVLKGVGAPNVVFVKQQRG